LQRGAAIIQIPGMIQNLNRDGQTIFIIAMISGPLAAIAVFLRLYSRKYSNAKYGWDDWWILFTLLSFFAFIVVTTWGQCDAETSTTGFLTSCQALLREGEEKTSLASFELLKVLPTAVIVSLLRI
jgi:hypothetical protein